MNDRNFLINVPSKTTHQVVFFNDGFVEGFPGVNDFGRVFVRLDGIEGKVVYASRSALRQDLQDLVKNLRVLEIDPDGIENLITSHLIWRRLSDHAEDRAKTFRGVFDDKVAEASAMWIEQVKESFPHIFDQITSARSADNTDRQIEQLHRLARELMYYNTFNLPTIGFKVENIDHCAAIAMIASLHI